MLYGSREGPASSGKEEVGTYQDDKRTQDPQPAGVMQKHTLREHLQIVGRVLSLLWEIAWEFGTFYLDIKGKYEPRRVKNREYKIAYWCSCMERTLYTPQPLPCFQFWLCYLPPGLWASYLPFMCPCFPPYKTAIVIVPTSESQNWDISLSF